MPVQSQDREFLETATNPGALKTLRLTKIAQKFAQNLRK